MEKIKTKKLHVKPTKKDLEDNIKKIQEDAEALKKKPEPTPSEPAPTPSEPPKPTPSEPPKEPEKPDYKEKFIASSKEAQILHAKNKKINEALEKAGQLPEPTEEEMKTDYPDWEMMSDFEKKMAKDTLISKKRFETLHEVTKEFKDSEKWQEKVDGFISDPKTLIDHSDLEGREDEFRLFATKPTRRGVDFSDLVSAFLYTNEKTKPKMTKGKMFETGTGGPVGKPKPKKISIEEARTLRTTDYKKYIKYLKAGKIATEI